MNEILGSNQGRKVAIMQPYLFPYIGYFQLIHCADFFVLFDDVNFKKRGWINRNQILMNKRPHRFVLPIVKASQNKLISELSINAGTDSKQKILNTIESAYKKSPEFELVFPVLSEIILHPTDNLAEYLDNSIRLLCNFMAIQSKILRSTQLSKKCTELNGEARIIELTQNMGGKTYVNAQGAITSGLYSANNFNAADINLRYLLPGNVIYSQGSSNFEPNLSIVDLLMFNDAERLRLHLENYSLVEQ